MLDVVKVVKILRLLNRGFGRVIDKVYLGRGSVYFDGGYVVGRFDNVGGLEGLGDRVVELGLRDLEVLFEDRVDVRVEGGVVVFDKGVYEVRVGVVGGIVEGGVGFGGVREEGVILDLDDVVFSGFDVRGLFGENVLGLVEECLVEGGRVVVVNPVWVLVGRVRYSGERVGVSRGLLVVGDELRGMGVKVVVGGDEVVLRFGEEGFVRVGKRVMVGKEGVDRVLEMVDGWGREGECMEMVDLSWVRDWERGEGIVLYVKEGRVVGVEVSGVGVNVRGGLFDVVGVEKYRVGAKFVRYVVEAEAGVLIGGRVLRLRKGDSDLYIAVMKEG